MGSEVAIVDLEPGLWIWRTPHPDWSPGDGGDRVVTSTYAESGGERVVFDPLAPAAEETELWERLDASPPTMAVVIKPDHVRSIDVFVERYKCRAFGPDVFFRDDIPGNELEAFYPGGELPGGLLGLHDGRGRNETPIFIAEHKTIVFSDALTALGGKLQVWAIPWQEYAVGALRRFLDLDFERVIVSHGDPVHDRAEFERALDREPFTGAE